MPSTISQDMFRIHLSVGDSDGYDAIDVGLSVDEILGDKAMKREREDVGPFTFRLCDEDALRCASVAVESIIGIVSNIVVSKIEMIRGNNNRVETNDAVVDERVAEENPAVVRSSDCCSTDLVM
eukprot:scaffold427_cov103-Alexandrium_tamarense.AAC.27